MASPKVHLLGNDVAVVAYVRLTEKYDAEKKLFSVTSAEETRVWHRKEGKWRMVHFHRSLPTA